MITSKSRICHRTLFLFILSCSLISCKKDQSPLSHTANPTVRILFTADNRLCAVNSDGTNYQVLITGTSNNFEAQVSPDRSMLAYASVDTTYQQIYLFDFSTQRTFGITNDLLFHESPTFSPDGKTVLFLTRIGWIQHMFLKNLVNGELKQLTFGYNSFGPAYSRDGSMIAFTLNNGLDSNGVVVMDRNGDNARFLGPGIFLQSSPSGTQLLYADFLPPNGEGLFIMNVDGSAKRFLSTIPFQTKPQFSPDGTRVVFSNFTTNFDIFVINTDGSNLTNLTNSLDAEFQPRFSPDSKRIIYIAYDSVSFKQRLCILDSDGSNKQIVIQDVGNLRDPIF